MAYDLLLADRVRTALAHLPSLEEKRMMGGLCFMADGKMCVGVLKDELMCRVDPVQHPALIAEPGCRTLDLTGRRSTGFILVEPQLWQSPGKLEYYIGLALAYNPQAKASKKRKAAAKEV